REMPVQGGVAGATPAGCAGGGHDGAVSTSAPHHLATKMIDVPSGQVAALDTGPAGDPPTVLMVPGYTGSKEDFGPLLDPLAAAQQIYQQGGIEAVYQVMEQLAQGDPNYLAQPVEVREFLRARFVANVPAGLLGMGHALRSEPDRVDELRAAAPALPLLVLY